ncbi:MAG: toll/interleukin-1 receptor domain-containing protein [Anaerolineales bacterium]
MSYDIFISYSSEDKNVADAVVAALENRGIRCWYAPRDIEAGTDWGDSITHAINDSTLMLLIFSKNSNRSKRVLDEVYYAISEGKTIIPFRIENLDPSGAMRLHLSSRHWLDAYDPSWEAHINKLVDTAASNLNIESKLSDDLSLIHSPSKKPGVKGLPWKLIAIISAVCIVIAGVIGVMMLQGIGAADRMPHATLESSITEETIITEEPMTPPPTLTPTPINTPTDTPAPTNSPTVAPTLELDLSKVVLSQKDLPSGFEEMSLAEFGLTKEDLSGDNFTVESIFAFMGAEPFELVMGFTTLLPTRLEQAGFDVALDQPEFMMESFISGLGATDILEQKELAYLNDIGDASAGMTVVADMEGIPMRMDMAIFRRDTVGAFVLVMYLDSDVPALTVDEASNKLDDRIVEMFPLGE